MRTERFCGCLLMILLVILFPCVITLLVGHETALPVSGEAENSAGQIRLEGTGQRINLQEYLIGVTAAQLPADTPLEAVKAQMILNRTYYYSVLGGRDNLSEVEMELDYLAEAERVAYWAESGDGEKEEHFLRAAVETEGLVMTCQRQLAVGMFHAVSSGRTRNLSGDYPYIHSVDSQWDRSALNYLTMVEYSEKALKEALGVINTGLQILEKDDAGYVESLLVGTEICSGEAFAQSLNLPSSAFTLRWLDSGNLQIMCKGQGHGYGMSLYGAKSMAGEGKTASEILQYYFKNVVIETWKKDE